MDRPRRDRADLTDYIKALAKKTRTAEPRPDDDRSLLPSRACAGGGRDRRRRRRRALGAGGYVCRPEAQKSAPPASQAEASERRAAGRQGRHGARRRSRARHRRRLVRSRLPYVFRRQPTFYRTLQPVGTVIVDKLQHFLYLIQPTMSRCATASGSATIVHDLAGLATSPAWRNGRHGSRRRNAQAQAAPLPGGPGNPLGARLLQLDDNTSRIHGTNAPKTIGNVVAFGCIRLVNDDIVDLYSRVKMSTPVVVN